MYSSFEGLFFTSVSMAAAQTSEYFGSEYNDEGAVQIHWQNADATDGYLYFEVTCGRGLDQLNDIWSELAQTKIYITEASGNCYFQIPHALYKRIRCQWVQGSNTTGTMNVRYIFKSRRG